MPEGILAEDILYKMRTQYGIMLAGSFGKLEGKVIRIGHMGANATVENMKVTLRALGNVLEELGVTLKVDLEQQFLKNCL